MSQEMEEQLVRLSGYFELMGLKTDKGSHLLAIQESAWQKSGDKIDLRKKIQVEIKNTRRQEGSKWNVDETVILDICLLLTVIADIYPNLIALKEEIEELDQLLADSKGIAVVTFSSNVKNPKNQYSFKITEPSNIKLVIDASIIAIQEQQKRVYENLLPGIIRDKRKADTADRFLYKATFLLSEYLEEKKDLLDNPPTPKLIACFYRYIGILPPLKEETDRQIESQRRTIDNWIKDGNKLIHPGK